MNVKNYEVALTLDDGDEVVVVVSVEATDLAAAEACAAATALATEVGRVVDWRFL